MRALLVFAAAAYAGLAHTETTDIASGPLTQSTSSEVRPNLMFILDDSASMKSDSFTGFESDLRGGTADKTVSRFYSAVGRANNNLSSSNLGAYNPAETYLPPVNADGSLKANSTPTAAPKDGYGALYSGTVDLSTKCYSTATPPTLMVTYSIGTDGSIATTTTDCKTASTASGGFTVARARYAFYYQYNNSLFVDAGAAAAKYDCRPTAPVYPNVDENRCYYRVDIIDTAPVTNSTPAANSFLVKNPNGTQITNADGTNRTRTYAQEIQNFANWFTWYRTRLNVMKTASGRAFSTLGDTFRVGFVTINPGSPVNASKYLNIARFTAAHKSAWYTKFYEQGAPGSTPLPEALARVGRHFAGKTDGINSGMNQDPIEYSCQQNFAILTTDGYWQDSAGKTISSGAIGNQDNVEVAPYVTRASGTFDGNVSGASDTLADVAMYYYKTDLRTPANNPNNSGTGVAVHENNVWTTLLDFATHQHMTTFTVGLGVSGNMVYRPDYQTATAGDYYKIRTGATGCAWAGGTCNWPKPAFTSATKAAVDDLWHAAVNGHGTYFSAGSASDLTDGLRDALQDISIRLGAAAASATSSPNITPADNNIYSTLYRTSEWDGEILAQKVDPTSGAVLPAVVWSAQALLDGKVADATDTRTIYTFNGGAASKLKPFLHANLSASERAYFTDRCVVAAPNKLSHCGDLSGAETTVANNPTDLINYLRGQTGNEDVAFRGREHVLGDTVNAVPHFLKKPKYQFNNTTDDGYIAFKEANATRQAMIYVGANDGMLHAFNADTGQEMWAYIPKMLLPHLWRLADKNYPGNHRYYVDGTPETMDICIKSGVPPACTWKTILVSGLGAGGRGFYALDVTDPLNPKGMWEICSDSTLCALSDVDIGLSYARPVVTKRKFDEKWVAIITSGINNVSPGDGKGYLYVLDAVTGAILKKVTTGAGDTAACVSPALCGPSGFTHISVHAEDFSNNNLGEWVYGGDLWGNVWRFDLSLETPARIKLAELKDDAGKPQSVTTYPEITTTSEDLTIRLVYIGTGRYLGISDLPDPASLTPALPYAYTQSLYAIKDASAGTFAGHAGSFRAAPGVVRQTLSETTPGVRTASSNAVNWASNNGWYLDFITAGERMVLNPRLISTAPDKATLFITTIVPFSNACVAGGDSWAYQFNHKTGAALSNSPGGQIGAKKIGQLFVGNVVVRLPDGTTKAISTTSTGEKTTIGIITEVGGKVARRMSWREIPTQ